MRRLSLAILGVFALSTVATAARLSGGTSLGFGTPVTASDLAPFFAFRPDGSTLPSGHGSVAEGRALFSERCAVCHGDHLEGVAATGGPALTGGRGTLTADKPKKTVESYWPYATTLYDYIKRAMPMNAPGSLDDAQVYALVAAILAQDKIVPEDTVMDRASLSAVRMPNRDGFRPYPGPDHRLYH